MSLLTLILPALLPVLADGARGLFSRITGGAGARPSNVKEAIELMQAETAKLKVIAELDKPNGTISPWVADLRASFRYLAAALILLTTMGLAMVDPTNAVLVPLLDMAASVFAFMFGDRVYMALKKGK